MVPKLNTETKTEAQSYAKQMYSLDKMSTISHKEFKDLNWLLVNNRFEHCVISIVFKFISGNCPYYLNEVLNLHPK